MIFKTEISSRELLQCGDFKGDFDFASLTTCTIVKVLANVQYLEPFNLFFYTWRYLTALEDEVTGKALKTFYRLFKEIAMALFPLPLFVFIGIFLREDIY